MSGKPKSGESSYAFGCYGMPVGVTLTIECDKDVMREGGRKRYCRTCVRMLADDISAEIVRVLREMGLR